MLFATELHQGNFIYHNGIVNEVEKIILMNPGTLIISPVERPWDSQTLSYEGVSILDVEGIPLTPEWLMKFGARTNMVGEYKKRLPNLDYVQFTKVIDGYQASTDKTTDHLVYVHTYQNWWKKQTSENLLLSED